MLQDERAETADCTDRGRTIEKVLFYGAMYEQARFSLGSSPERVIWF